MIAWIIVVTALALFLMIPAGVDAAYRQDTLFLSIKLGPIRLRLLPVKDLPKAHDEKKAEKKKEKDGEGGKKKPKPKLKPGKDDILSGVRLVLGLLSRFRRHLSVDLLRVHFVCAAPDPCDAVTQYGYVNAVFSLLSPLLHQVLKIRDEEIVLDLDVTAEQPGIDVRLVATLQIWEIFYFGFYGGSGFLRWFLTYRKSAKTRQGQARPANSAITAEQKG